MTSETALDPEPITVLLIHGREEAAQRVAALLTAQGLRVTAVRGVSVGQVEARRCHYDCLVLELGAAFDAISTTRALREESSTPIVVIASTTDVAERVSALDAGADACIAPSMAERELLLRIVASVRRARGARVDR